MLKCLPTPYQGTPRPTNIQRAAVGQTLILSTKAGNGVYHIGRLVDRNKKAIHLEDCIQFTVVPHKGSDVQEQDHVGTVQFRRSDLQRLWQVTESWQIGSQDQVPSLTVPALPNPHLSLLPMPLSPLLHFPHLSCPLSHHMRTYTPAPATQAHICFVGRY